MTRRFSEFSWGRLLVLAAFLALLFLGFYSGVLHVAPPLHSAGELDMLHFDGPPSQALERQRQHDGQATTPATEADLLEHEVTADPHPFGVELRPVFRRQPGQVRRRPELRLEPREQVSGLKGSVPAPGASSSRSRRARAPAHRRDTRHG
jgi:hypothetical protein